jgi:4'-phosphopantetheinyl transferase
MPLIKIEKINTDCNWGLWEIVESVDDLIPKVDFSLEDASEYEEIHNETKKLEWLSGKLMLKAMAENCGLKYKGIFKDENGKPFLQNSNYHISISHSQKFVAAIISSTSAVGIDLEKIKPKVLNVQRKFLAPREIEVADEDLETLTKYWCGKEALYKLQGKKGVIFSRDISMDLCKDEISCSGYIFYQNVVYKKKVLLQKVEDYIIAIAL